MDTAQIVARIERDLLYEIIINLESDNLSVTNAQNLAAEFLNYYPFLSEEDLYNKLSELGKKYPPARTVFLKYGAPYFSAKDKQRFDQLKANFDQNSFNFPLKEGK